MAIFLPDYVEIVDIETYQNYDSKGIDERICDEAAEDNEIVAGSAAFQPVYNGVDYSPVFDIEYYKANNPDVAKAFGDDSDAILAHFVNNGMREGRQASANFNVYSYAYKYPDLRSAFGNNLPNYYYHYINKGKNENRTAVGTTSIQGGITVYDGVDYSPVYNYDYYTSKYPDIKNAFGQV